VLSGLSPASLLETYVTQRGKTAADLIAFDREMTALFNRKEEREGEFAEYFTKSGRYMAGFTARYADSEITDGEAGKEVARGIEVGMRFPSAQVIRFCDCKAVQLQSVLRSDGRWRVVVFAGDINDPGHKERLEKVRFIFLAFNTILTIPSSQYPSPPSLGATHPTPPTSTAPSSPSSFSAANFSTQSKKVYQITSGQRQGSMGLEVSLSQSVQKQ